MENVVLLFVTGVDINIFETDFGHLLSFSLFQASSVVVTTENSGESRRYFTRMLQCREIIGYFEHDQ